MILPSLVQKAPILVARDILKEIANNNQIETFKVFYLDKTENPIEFPCEVQKISFFETLPFDQFDILHSHTLRTDFYLFYHKLLGRIKHSKLISTLHQYNYINFFHQFNSKLKAYLISQIWNLILYKHDKIIVLSRDMGIYYRKRLLNKKIEYIYNGRPAGAINSLFEDKELQDIKNKNFTIIGTSCRIIKLKGLEQVIKSLVYLPNTYFVVLGTGQEKEALSNLAVELGVEKRCLFLGFKNDPLNYYQYFDIFVLPSRVEGFPLSLIEAASVKKAIVCSNLPILTEAFSEDEVSFFQLDDIQSLVGAIHNALNHKKTLELKVYEKYINAYTSKKMAQNYFEVYSKTIKG